MKNSILIKILALVFLSYTLDCCSGCCGDATCMKTHLDSISLKTYNNGGQEPVEQSSDTIPAAAFKIELTLNSASESCANMWNNFLSGFSNKCLAFKCDVNILSQDTIEKVSIYSSSDFSPEYPAGTDLYSFFLQKGLDDECTGCNYILDGSQTAQFYLFQFPLEEKAHRFNVNLELTDGRVFSDTTELIVLSI